MEKLKLRKTLAVFSLAIGAAGLTSCTNYEGTGNDFDLTIKVEDTTKQSITGQAIEVRRADGEAADWFNDIGGTDEFHDNCDCDGFWRSRKQYGELRDVNGNVINPGTLSVGQCVDMQGKIRDNKEGKGHSSRPVYENAVVVPCG